MKANKLAVAPAAAISFDEFIFQERNHLYGAYELRKEYKKRLLVALFFMSIILATAISMPYILKWIEGTTVAKPKLNKVATVIEITKFDDVVPPAPPAPEPPKDFLKKLLNPIFEVVDTVAKDYPCYMCARMRRGSLYAKAKELGCNKLALGHHFNDVIETTMLNVLYAGSYKTMLPKLKAQNFDGLELIRPLYLVEEEAIKRFINNSGIWPLNCACMIAAKKVGNKRHEVKELIKNLKENNRDIDKSIFKSAENVYIDSILGWEKTGVKHEFLEGYEE